MPKKLILIIGPPGAGKTEDCKLVTQRHMNEINRICVASLIQEEIENKTAIGNIMNTYVKAGDLIPGEIIMYEVFDLIKNASKNIVLIDGLPRGLNQMKILGDALFHDKNIQLVSVIEIKISRETARKRLLSDDASKEEKELFEHKMDVYAELINEIEDYYKKDNLLSIVDGENERDTVVSEIDEILEKQVSLFA